MQSRWNQPRTGALLASLERLTRARQVLKEGFVSRKRADGQWEQWPSDTTTVREALEGAQDEVEKQLIETLKRRKTSK